MPDLAEEQEIFAATETTEAPQTAAPSIETPAAQPEATPAAPAAGEGQPQQPQSPQEPQERHVPYAALKEEREARKALQARVDELMTLMLKGQQQPAKQEEQQPEPELWDDPNAFIRHQISPVEARIQKIVETTSRRDAIREHGEETVNAAYSALDEAIRRGELNGDAVKASLLQSDDPYGDILGWYQKNKVLSEVGTDPKAFEERLRAKILAELQGQAPAGQQPAGAPAQQPSNSNQQPLPSLNRSYGNAGNAQGGAITEEDIFNAAPAFGRRKA